MTATIQIYQRHLREHLAAKGFVVWPPGRALQLGDVVVPGGDGDLHKQSDLAQLHIDPIIEPGRAQPMSATSDHIRKAMTQASASVPATGSGRVGAQMGDKGTVIFEVDGLLHKQIANVAAIQRRVLELYKSGDWASDWCLVDQVWTAKFGTIIVSESDNIEVELAVRGSDELPSLAALVNANANIEVSARGGSVTKLVGGRNFAVMFTCLRLNLFKTKLRRFATRGPADDRDDASGDPELTPLSLDEIEQAWGL